jgi:hypothetical protein
VADIAAPQCHLYMWCPNALLPDGLEIMRAWGFQYKTNVVWLKVRKDGGPDGRGVGFYFRNVTELLLFRVRGRMRTLAPGRRQVNLLATRKEEHSKKPDAVYDLIQRCSPGPYCEMFSRQRIPGWAHWGDEVDTYAPTPPPRLHTLRSRRSFLGRLRQRADRGAQPRQQRLQVGDRGRADRQPEPALVGRRAERRERHHGQRGRVQQVAAHILVGA